MNINRSKLLASIFITFLIILPGVLSAQSQFLDDGISGIGISGSPSYVFGLKDYTPDEKNFSVDVGGSISGRVDLGITIAGHINGNSETWYSPYVNYFWAKSKGKTGRVSSSIGASLDIQEDYNLLTSTMSFFYKFKLSPISYIQFRSSIYCSVYLEENIYDDDDITCHFIFGFPYQTESKGLIFILEPSCYMATDYFGVYAKIGMLLPMELYGLHL
ncbi:MAG: hypothetical protein AB1746_04830 [Candidatus Zixiibacteriota bacterium]